MPKSNPRLTKRFVDSLKPSEKDVFHWDPDLVGFGVRIKPSGVKSFVVQYRREEWDAREGREKNKSKRKTLGRMGALTVEEARLAAKRILADVALGNDPIEARREALRAVSLEQLCSEYLDAVVEGTVITKTGRPKADSTISIDRGRIQRHIVPVLGHVKASAITPADVSQLFRDVSNGRTSADVATEKLRGRAIVKGGKGTAKKAVTLLSAILKYGVQQGYLTHNPTQGFQLPRDQRRVVAEPEAVLRALGAALVLAAESNVRRQALDLVELIATTGMRRSEAVKLRWSEVDFQNRMFRLAETKSGYSQRPMSQTAFEQLSGIRNCERRTSGAVAQEAEGGAYVFPGVRNIDAPFGGLPGAWRQIKGHADLPRVQRELLSPIGIHHFRHILASIGDRMGVTIPTLAAIMGHSTGGTTAGYISRGMDAFLLSEADRLAKEISGHIASGAVRLRDGAYPVAEPSNITSFPSVQTK